MTFGQCPVNLPLQFFVELFIHVFQVLVAFTVLFHFVLVFFVNGNIGSGFHACVHFGVFLLLLCHFRLHGLGVFRQLTLGFFKFLAELERLALALFQLLQLRLVVLRCACGYVLPLGKVLASYHVLGDVLDGIAQERLLDWHLCKPEFGARVGHRSVYLCEEHAALAVRLTPHLCLDNEVVAAQRQGEGAGLCAIGRIVLHRLHGIKDFLVLFLDEVCHIINRAELLLAHTYLRELTIGECFLHGKQMGVGFLGPLLCRLYLSLQLRFGIVDIGLVGFPLLSAALVLAHVLFRIVLQ